MAPHAVQQMQQALEQMHLPLPEVVSAMNGKTGREMLHAILVGERDPPCLASHRDRRCPHAQATIAKAVAGHGWAAHRLALPQAVEQDALLQQQWRAGETQIEGCLLTFVTHVDVEPPQPTPARPRRAPATGAKLGCARVAARDDWG